MKNSDTLKIRMKLLKILSPKKLFFGLLLAFFLIFTFSSDVLADCRLFDCIPDEGSCAEGAVMSCVEGRMKCTAGRWVPTNEPINNRCVYHPMMEGSWIEQPPPEASLQIWEGLEDPEEIHKLLYDYATITNITNAGSIKLLGLQNPETGETVGGAVPALGNLIASMYVNPPASSVEYFADLGRNLGIAKPAYAQGVGFAGLSPILPIWKAFRNIAYLFFVIAFVIIGFAIMFRLKIDPQTVISIQNALPKIVVALILVTFSYAIAGLLIDLIYVTMSLLFALLGQYLTGDITNLQELLGHNVFTASWYILQDRPFEFVTAPGEQVYQIVTNLFAGMPIVSNIVGSVAGGLATFIFAIAIAFAMFKLFFSLLISYVSIIIGVIFAPLMLVLEALPGQRGLSSWIKMMLSNIIVFPLVAAIFMLGGALSHGFEAYGEAGWVAPFLGTGWGAENLPPFIALGIILMAPSIVDGVKKAIGAPGVAGLAAGIVQPITGAWGVVTAPVRYITEPIMAASQKARGEAMAKRLRLPGHERIP